MPARPSIPDPKPPIDLLEAAALRARGRSHAEIGRRLGYRASSIRRRLLEAGVVPPKPRARRRAKWGEKLYAVWKTMRRQAREESSSVSWSSFDDFYDWARAAGYRPGRVLRRKRPERAFSPGNCTWSEREHKGTSSLRGRPARRLTEAQWKRAERLHKEKGLSCPEIARRIGCCHGTILRGLKLRGSYVPPAPGATRTPTGRKLYKTWLTMHARCESRSDPAWVYYGAKGARVSRSWATFGPFRDWALRSGWAPELCLTRKPRRRVYSPSNCRWVTRAEAARSAHHSSSKMPARWTVTAFGETKGPAAWSRDPRCALTFAGLLHRLRSGWDPEEAIATPPQQATGPKPTRFIEAFGETRSFTEWTRDRRCRVKPTTLLRRLECGLAPEEAIGAPPYKCSKAR